MPDSPAAPRPPGPGPPADGEGATAPMETRPQTDIATCSPPSHPPAEEDDFQFLLCEGCRQESSNLKLLTCLHTLCLGCLTENKPVGQCPVCCTAIPQASGIPDMDNLLFTNLQARLKVYKQITRHGGPTCSRCQGEAALVWCCECEEFFCAKCFEDHQWWHKKKTHKVRKVEELRAESAHQFLEDNRKSCNLFCTSSSHPDQSRVCSIYCERCEKALCCSCALLDNQHAPFRDIRSETQRRQEELSCMDRELRRRRSGFEATYASLQGEAARLEEAQREMRELIRQRVEQLVRLIREEEEELVGLVEAQQEQGRRELARELRHVEGVLRRMEAGERLVEKMSLYATEQEVMDMQPFIKGSLQELQQLPLPLATDQVEPFAECRARLQALVERVTEHPGTSTSRHNSLSDESTVILDLKHPGKGCQPHGDLSPELLAHHKPCASVSDPSGSRGQNQGGDKSPSLPTAPALPMQREEEAEKDSGLAHGDTVPRSRSIQDTLASLQEGFSSWARSNMKQMDRLLRIDTRLLQAQQRTNRHLLTMTRELPAMSQSLATISSAVGPLLQPVACPQNPSTADVDCPSLPSNLLDLFPSNTLQKDELPVPAAAATPSPTTPPPATSPTSPARSEAPSSDSEWEFSKSMHPTRGKRRGKPSTRLRKRRK